MDLLLDYFFYEDASDEQKTEGTLLPLWDFSFRSDNSRTLEVTALAWNPQYTDLFAVGFGSCSSRFFFILCIDIFFSDDFENNKKSGVVCVYSLKNPSHPEYQCWTSHGVISLDIHPRHSHMIAVGLKNGDVAVFNLQKPCTEPSHQVSFSLISPLYEVICSPSGL